MPARFTHDLLIVGQGLAGSVLAATGMRRGLRVHVFDEPRTGSASMVSAGLVNPVSLRRTMLGWRAAELLPVAEAFYREAGQRLGRTFWHPVPLVKVFPAAKDADEWRVRMGDPEVGPYLSDEPCSDPGLWRVDQPHGHGQVEGAAWVDMAGLLNEWRTLWTEQGVLEERSTKPGDAREVAGGAALFGRTAPLAIWCTGPFAQLKGLVPVRGERLTVRMPGLGLGVMLHRAGFVLPLGGDDYRVGSTYQWDDVWSGPTDAARADLLQRLHKLLPDPAPAPREADAVQVVDHRAGVRPTTTDRRPLLGRTGAHQAVLNGLGSKGALLAPWCARHLLAHLLDGEPLDAEVDLARFA